MAESVFFGLVWSAATPSLHTGVPPSPSSSPFPLFLASFRPSASPIPPSLPPPSSPLLPSSRSPRPPLTLFTPSPLPPCPHATLYRVNYPALSSMPPHTTAGRNNKQPPVAMATRPSRANKTLRPLSLSLSPQLPFPGFISFHPQISPSPSPFSRSSLLSPVNVAHLLPPSLLNPLLPLPPLRVYALFFSFCLYLCTPCAIPFSTIRLSLPPLPLALVHRLDASFTLSLSLARALPPPLLTHSSLSLGFVEPIRAGWSTGLSFALLHACMSRTTKRPWNYIKTIPFGWLRFCGMFAVPLSSARGFFQAD